MFYISQKSLIWRNDFDILVATLWRALGPHILSLHNVYGRLKFIPAVAGI